MTEYQSNSHRNRELQTTEPAANKKVEKVVKGNVKTRDNKSRKIMNMFISEDAGNVKSYVVMDVLVPAVKKAISDIVVNSIDMILGTGGSSRTKTSSKISYRSYYDDKERGRASSYSSQGRFDYDDIIFESRGEAELVRRQMMDMIDRYGFVTVGDMYDMAGVTAPYTSNNYGWVNIRSAETIRIRDGYIIKLPKASPID